MLNRIKRVKNRAIPARTQTESKQRDHEFIPIDQYGFISDSKSSALVATDGSVDWLCWPRFDSPGIFNKILDEDGGAFSLNLDSKTIHSKQHYLINTNVLTTVIKTETGTLKITDWLHLGSRQAFCRQLVVSGGNVSGEIVLQPKFNYGKTKANFKFSLGYWMSKFTQSERNEKIIVSGFEGESENILASTLSSKKDVLSEKFVLNQNDLPINLSIGFRQAGPSNLEVSKRQTIQGWRTWVEGLRVPEEVGRDAVIRAALTIKGLQYEPTGAIISAATTSLPETKKEEIIKNRDRRLSWSRDVAFISYALLSVDRPEEVEAYFDWIQDQSINHGASDIQLLNPVGEKIKTKTLELRGYKNRGPCVAGTDVKEGLEIDALGELVDAISIHHRRESDFPTSPQRWSLVEELADMAAERWQEKNYGFWPSQIDQTPKNYTYSKVQCWVALDRAIRMIDKAPRGYSERIINSGTKDFWTRTREIIKEDILSTSYNKQKKAFVQFPGSDNLDSTNLLLARLGFIRPDSEEFIGTIRASQKHLVNPFGLLKSYSGTDNTDDSVLPVCSLWMVLALIEIKEYGEAEILYNRVLGQANSLGLFSAGIAVDGTYLGNYPEALAATGIIVAAFALDRHRDKQFDRRRFS